MISAPWHEPRDEKKQKKSPHDRVVLENGVYHFGMLLPCNSNVGIRYSSHV